LRWRSSRSAELCADEFRPGSLDHFLVEAGAKVVEQGLFTADEAGLEDRGPDGHVRTRKPDAFIDVTGGVPHFQAHVPKNVEDPLDNLLGPGCLLVGQHEQQIDVGPGSQSAAAIAADRRHGHSFGRGRVFDAVDMDAGIVIKRLGDHILQMADSPGAKRPAAIVKQHRPGALPAFGIDPLDFGKNRLTRG
jgi:hypothetical protein